MMSSVVTVELESQLEWQATKSESSGRWVGVCDAMNLSMEADSLDDLRSLIDETMQLVLIDLLEDNELDQFLRAHGWRVERLPTKHSVQKVSFDVPWHLIAEGVRDSERRAH